MLAGAAGPRWQGFLDDVGVAVGAMRGGSRWQAQGFSGELPDPMQVLTGSGVNLVPLVTGADGGILAGINWAIASGCRVISMSLGSPTQPTDPYSRVFEAAGPAGIRFTMTEPWTTLMLDDERVIHESTPIQPVTDGGHRDTLVITLRAGGFQGK